MIHTVVNFLINNGIGQNMTAGGLMGTPTVIWARRKLLKHVEELHLHIHALKREINESNKVEHI